MIQWAVGLVPPITILTALTVWFGFELVKTQAGYFGIDPSVLGYTTGDYVVRSVTAVLAPLIRLLIAAMVVIGVHQVVVWATGQERLRRIVAVVGIAMFIVGVFLTYEGLRVLADIQVLGDHRILRPWVIAFGVLLLTYGPWAAKLAVSGRVLGTTTLQQGLAILVCGVVVLCTFWSFSEYAEQKGLGRARAAFESHFDGFPRATVFSTHELAISGPGIEVTALSSDGGMYNWRYTGLRLLVRSDDKYFLVPVNWTPEVGAVVVLVDSADLRLEFEPAGRAAL